MKKSKKSDNTAIARKRVRPPSAEHEEVVGAAVGSWWFIRKIVLCIVRARRNGTFGDTFGRKFRTLVFHITISVPKLRE